MAVPQFVVSFTLKDGRGDFCKWVVSGEEHVDVLCKTLRWNGITAYSVAPFDADLDPRKV